MLENKQIEIGGELFEFSPMPVLRAAKLDKKVMALLTPLISGIKDLSSTNKDGSTDLDMDLFAKAITGSIKGLDDSTFTMLIEDTLAFVTWISKDQGAVLLDKSSKLTVFEGDLPLMYKVLIAAWRYNKFSPFALAETFGGLLKMPTSLKVSSVPNPIGVKSE